VEEKYDAPAPSGETKRLSITCASHAEPLSGAGVPEYIRSKTGFSELDRVLGGGLVHGSVVLLAGEPGIGKSTLLMQICAVLCKNHRVLYVSGEESTGQLKLRAERLGVCAPELYIFTETNISRIIDEIDHIKPDILIADSVQTLYSDRSASSQGSVAQVKECALALQGKAKNEDISVLLVGHVNKEGAIAGPKVLEHMVDAVLYFEGERQHSYRILRAVKNRYGAANELGMFEMTDTGLCEVENPSAALLEGRPVGISGSCAVCVMEGTRPLVAEIQTLVSKTVFAAPRRTSGGFDYNRMCLLLAVLEKRLGLRFYECDVYLNVIGGLTLNEPAADLAVAMALISGINDIPMPHDAAVIGEVGLAGEVRTVFNIDARIKEASRLGFKKIIIPAKNRPHPIKEDVQIIPVNSLYEAVRHVKQ